MAFSKKAECQEVTCERDAQVKEKEEFQRSVEELKQWLSAKKPNVRICVSVMLMKEKESFSEVLKN